MKEKTKKILIYSTVAGALVIVIGYIIFRAKKKREQFEKTVLGTVTEDINGTANKDIIQWPLKYGSGYLSNAEREAVKIVQKYLNKKIETEGPFIYAPLTVDGYFGSKTESALSRILGVMQVSNTLFNQMKRELNV